MRRARQQCSIGFDCERLRRQSLPLDSASRPSRTKMFPAQCGILVGKKRSAVWRHYLQHSNAVVFVLDSADQDHIEEAREELDKLLREPDLATTCLLVYANKQDLPNALTKDEVTEKLGLRELCGWQYFVQPAVATTGEGLFEGLDWLTVTLA
mmetsp:Transcript_69368/g.129572  ORF Transcript_69368/g.129572 Transcript_69368/m.129572 type:complete len:153 (+) Transcript_69368:110-568(+)